MGKAKTQPKAGAASSSPYSRPPTANIFKFNKDVGQHILKNPGVADAIVSKAQLRPTDVVVEIGPGTGNITVRLLQTARKVVAIEIDPRMAAEVTKRVQGGPLAKKLEVLLGDAIKTTLPPFDVMVSNTPYQISSPLVFKLLSLSNWRTAILMFQREFALRLTARPGDSLYSRLSVNAQFFAKITHVLKVGKANFKPMPQVESSVVKIEPKQGKERPEVNFAEWDSMLRICFSRKNKTLRASWLAKPVLAMVTSNYRIFASLNNISLDDGLLGGADPEGRLIDDANAMDMDHNVGPLVVDEDDSQLDQADEEEEDEWEGFDADMDDDYDLPEFFKELKSASIKQAANKTPSKRRKTKVDELVRGKIEKVLDSTQLSEKRSRQCDENDFLRLLYALNEEGIHFS